MQHNNLLKKAILALLLCVAMPCLNAQIAHIGDILCTGGVYVSPSEYPGSGLEAMGVIFYVDATGQHGWAVALEDVGNFAWGSYGSDTPLPNYTGSRTAIYDLDGLFNTQEVLNYGANNNKSFPAFEALDLANGWYLPAIGQLNYLYGNLVEVNAGLAATGGVAFEMSDNWYYWSSTEVSSVNAWSLSSSGGFNYSYMGNGYSGNRWISRRVRGVRNF